MIEVKPVGIIIVLTNIAGDGSDFISAKNEEQEQVTLMTSILNCLSERYRIEVAAFDIQDAINKILYRHRAGQDRSRQFLLEQIARMLVVVENKWKDVNFKADDNLRELIREDKMYRIRKTIEDPLYNEKKEVVVHQ